MYIYPLLSAICTTRYKFIPYFPHKVLFGGISFTAKGCKYFQKIFLASFLRGQIAYCITHPSCAEFHTWLAREHLKVAAFVLRPELAREAVRHFLFNEYVDLSFFPLFFKLSVIIFL